MNKTLFKNILFLIKNWRLVFYPAFYDYKANFARTYLGPLYGIISRLLIILAITFLWSKILNQDIENFFPYLIFGITIWYFILSSLQASINSTKKYFEIISNFKVPLLSIYFRIIIYNLIIVLQFLPILFLVYIFMIDFNFFNFLLFLFFFLLLIISITFLSAIIGIVSTYSKDLGQIFSAILNISTILTPIFWNKNMLGEYSNYIYFNPFTFYLEATRDVILNIQISNFSVIGFISLLFLKIVTLYILLKNSKKILFII